MPDVSASALKGAKEYEAIYVLRPDIDVESAARVANRVSDVIARERGTLVKVESWGRRKLAYPVRKFRKGIYYYLRFIAPGSIVAEFERNLRMQKDAVLKFMTVKVSDEVPVEAPQIDPEEVKFAAIEPPAEDELEESREKILGLIEHHEPRGHRDMMMDDDMRGPALDDDDSAPADDEEV